MIPYLLTVRISYKNKIVNPEIRRGIHETGAEERGFEHPTQDHLSFES
jgi:hypothetical protein